MAFDRVDYFRARSADVLLDLQQSGLKLPDQAYVLLTALAAIADAGDIPTFRMANWLREIRDELERDRT